MTLWPDWIGRGEVRHDHVSDRLIGQFRATLPELAGAAPVPPGLHWTLAPDALAPDLLGRDGHARLGVALPPLPLPRRMWAGGEVAFPGALAPGDRVEKDSRIESITGKEGSTGALIFIAIRHRLRVGGALVIDERQDLVYRPDPRPGAPAPAPPAAPDLGPPLDALPLLSDPVRLFRFSAMTFNGHRIHYDADYARGVEGYGGLVVHGPLQAVAMLSLATRLLGRLPARFSYRGLSPLICGEPAEVQAHAGAGGLSLRVVKPGGPVTMSGTAG